MSDSIPHNFKLRRKLGQHFLVSDSIAQSLVRAAQIQNSDTVFEIGTGLGKVTEFAAREAGRVITCDIDREVLTIAQKALLNHRNIVFVQGDAFKEPLRSTKFDVCLTSLPYSRSRGFIDWASERNGSFSRAIAIVQAEFASKLRALPGSKNYKAVSVIAQISFDIEELFWVDRSNFRPRPRVDSKAIRLLSKDGGKASQLNPWERQVIYKLFSFRRKLVRTLRGESLRAGHGGVVFPTNLATKRIEHLNPSEFLSIIQALRGEGSNE